MVSLSTPVSPPVPVRRRRDVRTARRVIAAAVMVLPATCIAIGRLVAPGLTTESTAELLDVVAANPGRQLASVLLGSLAMLTLVPAFLAAARLARTRRPVLATVAAGVNLVAYLGVGLSFGAVDNLALVGGLLPVEQRGSAAALIDAFSASGVFSLSVALFVFGHILGAVLMGLALRGSIPAAGWIAMAISQPLHFVCFVVLQNAVLDAMAWGLTAFAFVVCAVAVLRTPNDAWDLPPRSRRAG
jgi:hypothetical protein